MESCIALPNGRKIGAAEYGSPTGFPLLFFHGTPSSRINPTVDVLHNLIQRKNASPFRVIALERPGYGESDPQPDYTLRDWTEDTVRVADLLELERFAVLGVSGGGPYAVAVSQAAPERVTKTAVLSGMGPLDIPELRDSLPEAELMMLHAAEHAPEKLAAWAGHVQADPAAFVNRLFAELPEEQRRQVPGEILDSYIRSLGEACRRPDGLILDYRILGRPWNVPLTEIRTPIRFWHSDADDNVSIAHAEYLASSIPNAELVRLPGLNHYASLLAPLPQAVSYLSE